MALKLNRHFVVMFFVVGGRMGAVPTCATKKGLVLDKYAVMENDKFRALFQRPNRKRHRR